MLPVRGATGKGQEAFRVGHEDFNPCSPCGERRSRTFESVLDPVFQSMLPVRGATGFAYKVCSPTLFQSMPCSPCGERLQPRSQGYPGIVISIHAPRAGSDLRARPPAPDAGNFNPCSPCGERQIPHVFHGTHPRFQSMLPVRGATVICFSRVLCFFISIHAPRAGSDPRPFEASAPAQKFQSMLPVRGATDRGRSFFLILNISIHAPRAGSDICLKAFTFDGYNFNPCSPCGERLRFAENQQICFLISIHAPRAGSDYLQVLLPHQPRQFQSMLPVRGATFLPLCQGT